MLYNISITRDIREVYWSEKKGIVIFPVGEMSAATVDKDQQKSNLLI